MANKKIKMASSSLSNDAIRRLYNENFKLLDEFINESLQSGTSTINIIQKETLDFDDDAEDGWYSILHSNGSWMVKKNEGNIYIFNDEEVLRIGSKSQYILYGEVHFNDKSYVEIEKGGILAIIGYNT